MFSSRNKVEDLSFTQQQGSSKISRGTKRDQIARLLINKFRTKYQISYNSDLQLDSKVIDTVNQAVKQDQALGEKQLVLLSRKVAHIVEEHRKKGKVSQSTVNKS